MRLVIVSNRLPFTVTFKDGSPEFKPSAGGLTTGLWSYLDRKASNGSESPDFLWMGWPGAGVPPEQEAAVQAYGAQHFKSSPVFLPEDSMDRFYLGFCNKTIWPLFHYFPSLTNYEEEHWQEYRNINRVFSEAVVKALRPDDVLWIHDYHLMLLPRLVREKFPEMPIGFFLHIPFPSFEIFRLLPRAWREEIIEGLLGSSLIGFHTHDYAKDFLTSVLRTSGYEHQLGNLTLRDRVVDVDTFPMGVEFDRFAATAASKETELHVEELRKKCVGQKVIFSVDRLDYTKGLINRLRGYEAFLKNNPQWHGKVVFIISVAPSRIGVDSYQAMKLEVEQTVGRIVGDFGNVHWTPLVYQFRNLTFEEIVPLYRLCDVALITPLRDGMNLVAKEFIASRPDHTGVLILSEMAGAAKEMGEALIINPFHREDFSKALELALTMPVEEQIRRNQHLQERLRRYNVVRWADDFVQTLVATQKTEAARRARLLAGKAYSGIMQQYRSAICRALLLDYDGTLVPFASEPKLAQPDAELIETLTALGSDPANHVAIVSGRPRQTLEKWFGKLPVSLIAEHGVWLRNKNDDWRMLKTMSADWKERVRPIFQLYVDRLPGALLEEKEFSLAWHYRRADPEQGSQRAKELLDDLAGYTRNIDVQVFEGNKVIEIRNAGVNKGSAGLEWLSGMAADFILGVGDDWTDEDLFRALPPTAVSVRVGVAKTAALYYLGNHTAVRRMLRELSTGPVEKTVNSIPVGQELNNMPPLMSSGAGLDQEPFWYKSGVIYQVHVRAFYDANGDGTGDFRGLTQKLDYIKDLGVTAIWLLPFYPSPLKDDGYDIADYSDVHPMYGTLGDFKTFLREAHKRGLQVITELVLNHTSDQHPWFQRSRLAAPGSRWRDYYVWSDTPKKYPGARIIFKDVEVSNWTWDPVARAYFWHRFFSHQPDLNFENPEVHERMFKTLDFWLDLGVDGLRLDAVPYLYEREGTNCENLTETHDFLKKLRTHVDEKYGNRMLLAEANQWPEDAVKYFGQGRGDECHMAFHFPLMPRLFMALRMEDRLPIVDILEQTPPIPETSQWALFLRNHDELTLEMVTDEERDYMYRMYAQVHKARLNLGIRRRLAPLLNNDRKSIELLNALLFSLPGTPVLYYGDEIGLGENIYLGDRNGVRTPMQWSSDKNAGFSRANPQSLYLPIILDPAYHYEACNVEEQLANPHSLLWWTRRLLALRKRWRALGEGKCEFLQPDNQKILGYILRHEKETLLVVANLSRFTQPVELDLSPFKGMMPVELFGRTKFPVIADAPYFLTLGPHNFFWFSLETKPQPFALKTEDGAPRSLPAIPVMESWREIFTGNAQAKFEAILPDYFRSQPWFAGRSKTIKLATVKECFRVPLPDATDAELVFVLMEYVDSAPELYLVPFAFADGAAAGPFRALGAAELVRPNGVQSGVLYEAFAAPAFAQALIGLMNRHERLHNDFSELGASRMPVLGQILDGTALPEPSLSNTEVGNANVIFGDKLVLKFFRHVSPGVNPELEIGRFLTEKNFPRSPALLGALEYRVHDNVGAQMTLAVAKAFVPHAKNAWTFTMDAIGRYYDRVFASATQAQVPPPPPLPPLQLLPQNLPAEVSENVGTYLESARLLGARLAELHLALASGEPGGEFSTEPMTPHYLRGVFQSMRSLAIQNLRLLRKQLKTLSPELAAIAPRVIERETAILLHYRQLIETNFSARRIRIHGDCHLGQLLWTGRDFVFLDFEGNVKVPISERQIKRSPMQDVARMMRSFHHAAYAGFQQQVELGVISNENLSKFEPSVRYWNLAVSSAFLQSYCLGLEKSEILPSEPEQLRTMLLAYLLNQVLDELGWELRHGSDNVRASFQAILYLTEEPLPARTIALPGATSP